MTHSVTLRPFDITFDCKDEESILDAALRSGITLRYGCKHGNCGSCKAKISSGIVSQDDASEVALLAFERDEGFSLLCSAYPEEDLVIDLADDYQEEELTSGPPIGELTAELAEIRNLTHDIVLVRMALTKPSTMIFRSGQYVEIRIPGTENWRAFSMANSSSQSHQIILMIKLLPGGTVAEYLRNSARVGEKIELKGPYGQFRLSDGISPIVMVAGGSGMAPIASMLSWLGEQKSARSVTFYYGARSEADLFWDAELQALQIQLPNFRYVAALSEPESSGSWSGERGLITQVLERDCGNLRGSEGYLCGPPGMIDAAVVALKAKGMFSSRIRFDKFVSTESKA